MRRWCRWCGKRHDHNTQYGFLKQWSVDSAGTYIDGVQVSETTIADLMLRPQQPITVRIGIKDGAANPGGFNLFGRGFGNHDQDLALRLHYTGAGFPTRKSRLEGRVEVPLTQDAPETLG